MTKPAAPAASLALPATPATAESAPTAPPDAALRQALAQFATGITVVTTRAPDGTPVGLTVNSFASVSLQPPLVLWCLALGARSLAAFTACERYLIHVLGSDQLEVARRFTARDADRFAAADWHDNPNGLPLLDGGVAWLECRNRGRHNEGDHVILVGEVTAFENRGGAPLIFHDSRYVTQLTEAPLPTALRSPWR